MENLCIICCYSYPYPSTESSIIKSESVNNVPVISGEALKEDETAGAEAGESEVESSNDFRKICKEFYSTVLKDVTKDFKKKSKKKRGRKKKSLFVEEEQDSAVDPLKAVVGSNGFPSQEDQTVEEEESNSNSANKLKLWKACPDCTTAITNATVVGGRVNEVEMEVRKLQRSLLKELLKLEETIGLFSFEMKKVEEILKNSDKACLKKMKEALLFREMILNAAEELHSYQKSISSKNKLSFPTSLSSSLTESQLSDKKRLGRKRKHKRQTPLQSRLAESDMVMLKYEVVEDEIKIEPPPSVASTEGAEDKEIHNFLIPSNLNTDQMFVVDHHHHYQQRNQSKEAAAVPVEEEDDPLFLGNEEDHEDNFPLFAPESEQDDNTDDPDFEFEPVPPKKRKTKKKVPKRKAISTSKLSNKTETTTVPPPPPKKKRNRLNPNPKWKRRERGRNKRRQEKIDFSSMSPFRKLIVTNITRMGRSSWSADDPRVLNPMEYDATTGFLTVGSFKNIIINEEEQSLDCPRCDFHVKSFGASGNNRAESEMFSHVLGKHLKCLTCSKCIKNYSSIVGYHAHMRSHDNDELNKCDICGKLLNNRHAIRLHKWSHLNEEEKAEAMKAIEEGKAPLTPCDPMPRKPDKEKMWPCSTCGKEFKGSHLKEHELTHTEMGASIYRCTKCGKKMTRGSLSYHRRFVCIENAVEGYVPPRKECPYCIITTGPGVKTFKNNTMLRMHVSRTHPEHYKEWQGQA